MTSEHKGKEKAPSGPEAGRSLSLPLPSNGPSVPAKVEESDVQARCRIAVTPSVGGAITIKTFRKYAKEEQLTIAQLALTLQDQATATQGGDLRRAEGLLMVQAHTLDGIFNELAQRAASNMGEYIDATETYLRLALKAQSQCRATPETLAAIKNPPVVFTRQANIANGPQQVNNGLAHAGARAGETESSKTNYQEAAISYYRTPEHRALRAELIQRWRPWEKSTGPKSEAGKAKVSRNPYRGGIRATLISLRMTRNSMALRHDDGLDQIDIFNSTMDAYCLDC